MKAYIAKVAAELKSNNVQYKNKLLYITVLLLFCFGGVNQLLPKALH